MYFPEKKIDYNIAKNSIIALVKNFASDSFSEEDEINRIQSLISYIEEISANRYYNTTHSIHDELLTESYYLLNKYRQILLNNSDIEKKQDLKTIKIDLLHLMQHKNRNYDENIACCIVPDVKPYKSMCIFLLSRPDNNSSVVAEILSHVNYLDRMTREVTFIMPGYRRAHNEYDKNMQLTFDENIFIDIIQDIENKSNGKYEYLDDCELLLVGMDSHNNYDFDNFVQLDLNYLKHDKKNDIVKLIIAASHYFRNDYDPQKLMSEHARHIINSLKSTDSNPTKKVFIAGSKKLNAERALIREEISKVANVKDLDVRSLTFEDFATSLTGKNRGRQASYNKFIEEDANIVVFVFDTVVGEITEEEFNIAYSSLSENNHPDIFGNYSGHLRPCPIALP